jgi:hypothetical protein
MTKGAGELRRVGMEKPNRLGLALGGEAAGLINEFLGEVERCEAMVTQ